MAQVTFTRTHCDVLSSANESRDDNPPERGQIVERLRELDREIPDAPLTSIRGLDLHRHWAEQFLTCLWYPTKYNSFRVNEIYLRYGKSRAEMQAIEKKLALPRLEGESPEFSSFPAHIHMSIGVQHSGFFYQLVVGPHAWPDLEAMMRVLRKPTTGDLLLKQFCSLEESGYLLFFGKEKIRNLNEFQSGVELAGKLSRLDHLRGQEWFGIRKDIEIRDAFEVSSADLIAEIQRMFPAFTMIARQQSTRT